MKRWLAAASAILLSAGTPALGHRLDEYLQATTISLGKDRVRVQVRLAPGVAVLPIVFARIDGDADGVISEAERQAYAERVLRDVSLTLDDERVPLGLVSSSASTVQEMRDGLGEIQIEADAAVPHGRPDRRLVFENHHESRIAAYLVNSLVPSDPHIRVAAQNRSYDQSFYQLDYVETGDRSGPLSLGPWSSAVAWLGIAALVLLARLASLWRRRQRGREVGNPAVT